MPYFGRNKIYTSRSIDTLPEPLYILSSKAGVGLFKIKMCPLLNESNFQINWINPKNLTSGVSLN